MHGSDIGYNDQQSGDLFVIHGTNSSITPILPILYISKSMQFYAYPHCMWTGYECHKGHQQRNPSDSTTIKDCDATTGSIHLGSRILWTFCKTDASPIRYYVIDTHAKIECIQKRYSIHIKAKYNCVLCIYIYMYMYIYIYIYTYIC